ncbi:MAG: hypothetical protein ACLQHS_01895 [Candidatus Limnocylindrales bacterium]
MRAKPEPPQTIEDYRDWYAAELGYDNVRDRTRYDSSSRLIRDHLASSAFWRELARLMPEVADEYEFATSYPLLVVDPRLTHEALPELLIKPFDSLIEKTWRKNALDNPRWDRPPQGGWITPENWYERVGDMVRTTVAVKYLDGVTHLQKRIARLAAEAGLRCEPALAARREGYYAAHLDIHFPVELPGPKWATVRVWARAELQITTQLQEVIRRLLHRQYESDRVRRSSDEWEWDFHSDAFHVNYLGHVLHYLEGKIMDEREGMPHAGT